LGALLHVKPRDDAPTDANAREGDRADTSNTTTATSGAVAGASADDVDTSMLADMQNFFATSSAFAKK
jgi:hypothetical protein